MQILTPSDSYRYVVATSMSSTKVMNSLIDLSVSVKDKRHKYHEDILRSYEQKKPFYHIKSCLALNGDCVIVLYRTLEENL